MTTEQSFGDSGGNRGNKLPRLLHDLLHALLFQASEGISRREYLLQAIKNLSEASQCDAVVIRLEEKGKTFRCAARREPTGGLTLECPEDAIPAFCEGDLPESLLQAVLRRRVAAAAPNFTRGGSFWTGDSARPVLLREEAETGAGGRKLVIGGKYPSLALIPIPVDETTAGILKLASSRRDFFAKEDIHFYESVAEAVGVAIAYQEASWALGERVKELSCLYGVAKALQREDCTVPELLQGCAEILPQAWQFSDIASARITLDDHSYATPNFVSSPFRISAPLIIGGKIRGSIDVSYREARPEADEGPFLRDERNLIDGVAETLGLALSRKEADWALRERVKELTCLYGIARIAQRADLKLFEALSQITHILPPAWQYPNLAFARLTFDGRTYQTEGFKATPFLQESAILVRGVRRGTVQVAYSEERSVADEGPFLKEERNLIDEIANRVGAIIEAREAEQEKEALQAQLRHADRLATIGLLSAGTAHELNEPLGSILGFAQLAKKAPKLQKQTALDLDKIIGSALHAREVVRKLMIFARQMPIRKERVDLNRLVNEGLFIIESRCLKEGIKLHRDLASGLPEITADPSQLHQVLVNLAVNGIQAMKAGGTLTIRTSMGSGTVSLILEDTGEGMKEDVQKQIFLPFFTTKEIGQGTGLGLSVVHGIVSSHGGKILVSSEPGRGSRFEVRLPLEEAGAGEGGG
jgi:signal transduction histidine kinase